MIRQRFIKNHTIIGMPYAIDNLNINTLKKEIIKSLNKIAEFNLYIYGGTALELFGIIPANSSFDIDAYVHTDALSFKQIMPQLQNEFNTNEKLIEIFNDPNYKECDTSKNVGYIFTPQEVSLFNNKLIIYEKNNRYEDIEYYQIILLVNYNGKHNHILELTLMNDPEQFTPNQQITNKIYTLTTGKLFENNVKGMRVFTEKYRDNPTPYYLDKIKKYFKRVIEIAIFHKDRNIINEIKLFIKMHPKYAPHIDPVYTTNSTTGNLIATISKHNKSLMETIGSRGGGKTSRKSRRKTRSKK